MKKILFLLVLGILVTGKISAQESGSLSALGFAAKMKQLPNAPIIDVRTSQEFAQGHIKNARNVSVNSDDFAQQINKIEKAKPVFVYCLSGGRSSYAANAMRSMGFTQVYELAGGMMKWRASGLPETTDVAVQQVSTMSKAQFQKLLKSDKLVLIDFYAEWCAPCRKMKPDLEAISKERKETVDVVRINADEQKQLAKELKVDALPVLFLYKNSKLIWTKRGYASKSEIEKQLNLAK